jgi:transposase
VDTKLRADRLLFGGVHMKKNKRRNHTDEFKEEAVKLVTEQHYKVTEASGNLGVHHSLLRRWIKAKSQIRILIGACSYAKKKYFG